MEIQSANLLDLNALRTIEKICFPLDAWPLLDLIAVLSFSGVLRLKIVKNGQMIGFAAGDPHPNDGFSWIATIGILPEYRGKGLGRELLQTCEDRLPTPRIRLSVRASNEGAIRLYKSCGYQIIDHWYNYYNDGEDAIVMEKLKENGAVSAL